ncbi:aldose 1-epimerase [Vallitalea longa]|uniref:Aldose 1-epimerase n=1 Tax=Vallitalea longa TaxID=2936439 RepID=A0A9W6DE86_9FIRM|nr:aldose epimerase family protein [Vallitalea longa]GKX28142.1 aldose 1-epimerase [Vallitalea longa]
MEIKSTSFGITKSGKEVTKYTLYNDNKCSVSILNYGGIVNNIMVPDKNGNIENIVLGFDDITSYEEKSPFFGCLVGRVAGRISNASFKIDDNVYTLHANDNGNTLHGGLNGFNSVIWDTKSIVKKDSISLILNYLSKDGEEGFPGNLDITVTYTFNNNNELEIQYNGNTDKKTLVNMTNHSYFNLSGNGKRDILEQYLQINADKYGLVDTELIPNGIADVKNTAFDFRNMKLVGQDIKNDEEQLKNAGGYDHFYILDDAKDIAATMYDETSGRYMEVVTDQKSVIFYASNTIEEGVKLASDIVTKKHIALCLETQYYPDAINQDCFESKILNPGDTYKAYTKYCFKVK